MANKRIRKKSEKRRNLEQRFRTAVNAANNILENFEEQDIRFILDDDYGAIFADNLYTNKKGYFRSNATKRTNAQLENAIDILETLVIDAPEYEKDANSFKELAQKIEVDSEYVEWAFWEFIKFASSIVGHQVSPSDEIAVIARTRLENGESLEEVEQTFYGMYMNTTSQAEFIYEFSNHGVLL